MQLIYARASDVPDRYAEFLSSFRSWAGRMDDIFNLSAAHTGGTRHIRFVHDTSCQPIVDKVELSPEGDDFMNATTEELAARGYNRTDRKYLVWMDATVYCGVANGWHDDSPDQENVNNGSPIYPGMTARIDTACWGLSAPNAMIEAHELGHVLGAVQRSAPNASQNGHCTDEYDVMCYRDGPSVELRYLCLTVYDYENRLDCNHDDYFHTNPAAGSYLATHWNVANSRFLSSSGVTSVTPSSVEPGDLIRVSGTAATPNSPYRVRMATSGVACSASPLVLGGSVTADAAGSIPPVSRTIPTNTTSGSRFVCLVRVGDASDSLSPASLIVV